MYLGESTETKKEAAIKIYDYGSDITPELINQEKEIAKSLSHANIIPYIEFLENIDFEDCRGCSFKVSALVMENATCGTLLDLIESVGSLSEILTRTLFCQLLDAIEYMHEKGIAHRDIKPENILLDGKYCLKLTDFGHSLDLTKTRCTSKVGTSQYFPPEMHAARDFDAKEADLFAAAIMLFCMISGSMPFEKATESDALYKNFVNGSLETFWEFHEAVSSQHSSKQLFTEELKDLLEKMLNPDPKKRLTLKEIRKHDWCQKEKLDDDGIVRFVNQLPKAI